MPARRPSDSSFVDRYALWTRAQEAAAAAAEREVKKRKLDTVRFSFVDQHGILRGKAIVASEFSGALRAGVTMTSTLLAKDTSHRTVFPVFTAGGGLGLPEMKGAGNIVMVADPATFRALPWADGTGWVLCDIFFDNGKPVPISTRQLYRGALAKLAGSGYEFFAGLEVEFHLFRIVDSNLSSAGLSWPPQPPAVAHTTHGFQYLTEARFDQVEPIMRILRANVEALDLPLRSMEVELGASQYEFTFAPAKGLAAADMMIMFRNAMKQVARRHGYLVSFMCRPKLPNIFSSGWHLHQSLLRQKSGANAFVSATKDEILSPLGRHFLAGLLAHARAAAAFTTPTINGYKRYRSYSMAPDRAIWARDNRGAMIRVLGEPGDAATHLENRVGEPAANPYLYMASQIYAGLDGIARKLDPGSSTDIAYETEAEPLPKNLGEALAALKADACFRDGFGQAFVEYFAQIKEAEIARCRAEEPDQPEPADWEHREYFDLF